MFVRGRAPSSSTFTTSSVLLKHSEVRSESTTNLCCWRPVPDMYLRGLLDSRHFRPLHTTGGRSNIAQERPHQSFRDHSTRATTLPFRTRVSNRRFRTAAGTRRIMVTHHRLLSAMAFPINVSALCAFTNTTVSRVA